MSGNFIKSLALNISIFFSTSWQVLMPMASKSRLKISSIRIFKSDSIEPMEKLSASDWARLPPLAASESASDSSSLNLSASAAIATSSFFLAASSGDSDLSNMDLPSPSSSLPTVS